MSAVAKKKDIQVDQVLQPEKKRKPGPPKGSPQVGGHVPSELMFDDPANIERLRHLASRFLSIEHIAASFQISRQSFYNILDRRPQLREVIEQGKSRTIEVVTNGLLENAEKGVVDAQKFVLKAKAGWREQVDVQVSGSVRHELHLETVKRVDQMTDAQRQLRLRELQALDSLNDTIDVEFDEVEK